MPKRKTADVTAEAPTAAEPRKKASTAKPKTAAAATHKRTSASRTTQVTTEVAAVVAEPVAIAPVKPVAATVTREQIAMLAYSYWEARGYQPGSPEEDWLRAERALTLTA